MLAALLPLAAAVAHALAQPPLALAGHAGEPRAALARGPAGDVADPLRGARPRPRPAGPDGAVLATGSIYLVADLVRAPGAESASAL